MASWTQMTPDMFDTDAKMVQGALFAAPDTEQQPGLFAFDELDAR